MTASERQMVQNKITALKEELGKVEGSKCEVYSRVVGYLRPVQSWNKGKKEEFFMRKGFKMTDKKEAEKVKEVKKQFNAEEVADMCGCDLSLSLKLATN